MDKTKTRGLRCQVLDRCTQPIHVFGEVAYAYIAISTENPSNTARLMVMVRVPLLAGVGCSTDDAATSLALKESIPVRLGKAVLGLQVMLTRRSLGIGGSNAMFLVDPASASTGRAVFGNLPLATVLKVSSAVMASKLVNRARAALGVVALPVLATHYDIATRAPLLTAGRCHLHSQAATLTSTLFHVGTAQSVSARRPGVDTPGLRPSDS